MELKKLKNSVMDLIANNRIENALNFISLNDKSFKYSKTNEVMLLMSRFNALNRDDRLGTITNQQSNMRRNQIVQSILSICEIKEGSVNLKGNLNIEKAVQLTGVSLKEIKSALKKLKNDKDDINYYEAVDILADLF